MADRYTSRLVFHVALGWLSEVADTQSQRRILIAGAGHEALAKARAEELNAARGQAVREPEDLAALARSLRPEYDRLGGLGY